MNFQHNRLNNISTRSSRQVSPRSTIFRPWPLALVGCLTMAAWHTFAVAADGDLDTSFGTGGKVTTAIGNGYNVAYSVALQADGKIVVAGYSYISNYDFAVVRYNIAGVLDTSFGTGGKVTTAIGSSDDLAYSVALQANGKIVVAGSSYNGSDYDFAMVRYNTDGTLDTSFGTGGQVTTAIGSKDDIGNSVALQADGKIVVAGYSDNGSSDYDFAMVRYNTEGTLDTSFGTGGKVTTAIGSASDYGNSVALQADGKIVVAGFSTNGSSNCDLAVVRYNSNGTLDTSFGMGGKVTIANGGGNSIALQTDGKIVVAGKSYNGGPNVFVVVRYNTEGTLDTSFGTGGQVTTAIGNNSDMGNSVALQADGKIVVAGYSFNGSDYVIVVVRYLVNSAPVAMPDSYNTTANTTLTVATATGVLANDTDVDNNPLTATLGTTVSHGTLTLNQDGSLVYIPTADWSGTDSFTYFANDGTVNSTSAATVTITVTPPPPR